MFEGPEYASYLQLMRELRLERSLEAGDCYVSSDDQDDRPLILAGGDQLIIGPVTQWWWVWLPRLDQWLEMLEKGDWAWANGWDGQAGWMRTFRPPHPDQERYHAIAVPIEVPPELDGQDYEQVAAFLQAREVALEREFYGSVRPDGHDGFSIRGCPTREEAAARLWLAVTGRTVPA